jgi:hypothetical protein
MTEPEFVPREFVAPTGLTTPQFRLTPLGPEHNEPDFEAWTSSVDHITATPGFANYGWPHPMTLEENLGDLIRHEQDFEAGRGFTYTVQDVAGSTIGCVYIYPLADTPRSADVRSWVTAARAELDVELYRAVTAWLDADWPFERVRYAARPDAA